MTIALFYHTQFPVHIGTPADASQETEEAEIALCQIIPEGVSKECGFAPGLVDEDFLW